MSGMHSGGKGARFERELVCRFREVMPGAEARHLAQDPLDQPGSTTIM